MRHELYTWLKSEQKSAEYDLNHNDGWYVHSDYYNGRLNVINSILEEFYKHYNPILGSLPTHMTEDENE